MLLSTRIHAVVALFCLFTVVRCEELSEETDDQDISPIYSGIPEETSANDIRSHDMRIQQIMSDVFEDNAWLSFYMGYGERALDYWKRTLKVKYRSEEPLFLPRPCVNDDLEYIHNGDNTYTIVCRSSCVHETQCKTVQIDPNVFGACREKNGENITVSANAGEGLPGTDFLLIVEGSDDGCGSKTYAWSHVCYFDLRYNRPIAGILNLCPKIRELAGLPDIATGLLKHELAHLFGFTPSMYAFMRDEAGLPRTPRRDRSRLPLQGKNEHGFYIPLATWFADERREWVSAATVVTRNVPVMKTPNVVRVAREHFNCPTLTGVDLESQDEGAHRGSHFEKRWAAYELMASSPSHPMVVSALTLAFFQDTGWYDVITANAEEWAWGKGMGCDFLMKSCYSFMTMRKNKQQSFSPWCMRIEGGPCGNFSHGKQCCGLYRKNVPMPEEFRNYDFVPRVPPAQQMFYSGDDEMTDFCAYDPYTQIVGGSESSATNESDSRNWLWILIPLFVVPLASLAIFLVVYLTFKGLQSRAAAYAPYRY